MIRDPVPALRLCGNVLQLLDLSHRLLDPAKELDQSVDSLTVEYTDLYQIYHTLKQLRYGLAIRLTIDWSIEESISYGDEGLQSLAQSCQGICAQLLVATSQLERHYSSSNGFTSFQEALQAVWDKKPIEALEEGLLACRRETIRVLTIIFRETQSSVYQEIQSLKEQNRQIDQSQTRWLTDILDTLSDIEWQATEVYIGDEIPGVTNTINPDHLQDMARRMPHAIQKASKVAFVQRFLRTLHFQTIKDRHARIAKAHEKTFTWNCEKMIDTTTHPSHSPAIVNWLRGQNDSIFWVSGKPASGKSTFMKYLLAHPQTQENLKIWAGSDKLVIASHFFWGAGTDLQNSKHGLLQSLLYGIFTHSPDLIPIACQQRWEAIMRDEHGDSPWCVKELFETLKTLISQTIFPSKFCFFIDGLDEYTGDHSELIELLSSLVQANVMMCLSSRPWKVFEDAYGESTDRKLYLEEHNRDDIHNYVQSEIEQHSAWGLLVGVDSRTSGIIDEIADRAQGVFLWAVLVVRSFGEWLTNGDTLFFLQKKLRRIPITLELLLRSMIESIDPIYTSYMRQIFKVALTAPEPLPVMPYASLERQIEDDDNAPPQENKPLTYRDIILRVHQLDRQLTHICKGLLVVYHCHNEEDALRYRVDFLHRTVRDFFSTNDTLRHK
ncbi:hypothetical protein BDV27DRAFT_136426 [Aspergillus caelatus]|uniref:NACHT domain-containing protein n=1 Tax=Aspergillus caelatus TaxID=61420 RepID=A0A5N6ZPA7_9EURO|nr:uncharacterized protein BDV27DRAFT_136426 [Aspergillus caelatus]KAE8359275.1 hypothetical protein BDV27DRAFT_136426 [Aspergillus caelatus]